MNSLKSHFPNQGFGTDQIPAGSITYDAVKNAIKAGYRLIDNADCYYNEESVGLAINDCIKEGIVSRKDLFATNKVPDWKQGYSATIRCCKESLKRSNLDYFDLYLVHSPLRECEDWKDKVLDTYRALEFLQKQGLVKRIGVSNFAVRHLELILNEAEIKPFCNQIEFHPQHQQREIVSYCKDKNIIVEGWGTLNQGRIFNNETFKTIADKYNKSIAQIAIVYSMQSGVIPLVRSTKRERIFENYISKIFKISDDDMKLLNSLDGGEFSNWHHDGIKIIKYVREDSILRKTASNTSSRYYLFGFIPFLKCKTKSNKTKYYLFGLPILKIKSKKC